jgi:hypothetical protein
VHRGASSLEDTDFLSWLPSAERTLSSTVEHSSTPSFLLFLRFISPLNCRFSHRFSSRYDREEYDPKLFFVKV